MRQILTLVGTSLLTNGRSAPNREHPTASELLVYLRGIGKPAGSAETNSL